jgi:hypothetical protein
MDKWEFYEDFAAIYRQTMERLSADEFYYFNNDYFARLRSVLGNYLHLCTVFSPAGDLAAAGLLTSVNGIVQCHLSATHDQYVSHAPSKMMFDHARRWAKEAGQYVFHMGGGVGGCSDSLFQFKAGFSKSRNDYYTYRMVLDEDKYDTLNSIRRARTGEPNEGTDFFPPYRGPSASEHCD